MFGGPRRSRSWKLLSPALKALGSNVPAVCWAGAGDTRPPLASVDSVKNGVCVF